MANDALPDLADATEAADRRRECSSPPVDDFDDGFAHGFEWPRFETPPAGAQANSPCLVTVDISGELAGDEFFHTPNGRLLSGFSAKRRPPSPSERTKPVEPCGISTSELAATLVDGPHAADFDGDGIRDAWGTRMGDDASSLESHWYKGFGHGRFGEPRPLPLGFWYAKSDIWTDLDGDGLADSIITDHGVSIAFQGQGDGSTGRKLGEVRVGELPQFHGPTELPAGLIQVEPTLDLLPRQWRVAGWSHLSAELRASDPQANIGPLHWVGEADLFGDERPEAIRRDHEDGRLIAYGFVDEEIVAKDVESPPGMVLAIHPGRYGPAWSITDLSPSTANGGPAQIAVFVLDGETGTWTELERLRLSFDAEVRAVSDPSVSDFVVVESADARWLLGVSACGPDGPPASNVQTLTAQ